MGAARALHGAIDWKLHPEMLATSQRFSEVPARLRQALALLLGVRTAEVVLANSASYGLHLIAHGLDLRPGDEVIVATNDFPSNVLPWLLLRERGVEVHQVEPTDEVLTVDELERALGPRTRAVCLSWVHSFSGQVLDIEAVGALCRSRGVWFVVNGSQAVGVRPIALEGLPVDALATVGFKWLCGPYGTGMCYISSTLQDRMTPQKLYWLSALSVDDLAAPSLNLSSLQPRRTGRLDIFGTANFFNFVPFAAAVELLTQLGVDRIAAHVDALIVRVLAGLDRSRYRLVSSPDNRSSLIVIEPLDESTEAVVERLTAAHVYVAQRRGRLRISPHLYNTQHEIDRLLDLL